MQTNHKPTAVFTHEGPGARITPLQTLRRSVLACLLWEDGFYEDGVSIAERIRTLAGQVDPNKVAELALEARHVHHLRHVPLLLLVALAERRWQGLRHLIPDVISRADEIAELTALYWALVPNQRGTGKTPLTSQMRRGLRDAFHKFNGYQLAKYDRDKAVRPRDVMFLTHPKPRTAEEERLFKGLADQTLEAPDTWEVALSGGADKGATFTRLLQEERLGYLALLRNLRGMLEAGVDRTLIEGAITARKGADRVLPFRYVAAARAAPSLEPALDKALIASIAQQTPLPGQTIVLVDVSGSMGGLLSTRSDLTRMDAAATLASVLNAESVRVFTFSEALVEVPARRGMAGIDAIVRSQPHSGTHLRSALEKLPEADRLIVITDEQSHDGCGSPPCANSYMINVASNEVGVGYGAWTHLDGFSEGILRYIAAVES